MEVVLVQLRGFCVGVVRAIDIVDMALDIHGAPVYVFHEIVHNQHVVEGLHSRGAVFVESLQEVPEGAITIFSAHGVADAIVDEAKLRNLQIIDATCPLVTKVHLQAQRYSKAGYSIIIIGHLGHEEVDGTMGSVSGPVYVISDVEEVQALHVADNEKLAYVTQTTLSVDDTRDVIEALEGRFPDIVGPSLDDICYATQNRQNAVRDLSESVDLLLVVGARNSSNSNRLREVGEVCKVPSYLIQDQNDLDPKWFTGDINKIGISAGASSPEVLVQAVIEQLRSYGVKQITELDGMEESTTFRLPKTDLLQAAEPGHLAESV